MGDLHEAAWEVGGLQQARLTRGDDLDLEAVGVGVAVQLECGVVGDHPARAQAGGRQEPIDRPGAGVGMLWNGGEDSARKAADVARLQMLGEHRRDDLVGRRAAEGRGILGAIEHRRGAEERGGDRGVTLAWA